MSNKVSPEEYEKRLAEQGYPKEIILDLYKNQLYSKNAIISEVNNKIGKSIVNKDILNKLFTYWNIQTRDKTEEVSNSNIKRAAKRSYGKTYGNSYTQEQILDLYQSGMSLAKIYQQTGVSPQTTRKMALENNISIRKQVEYTEIIDALSNKGVDGIQIEDWYINQNCSQSELQKKLSDACGLEVGNKSLIKILDYYKIEKSQELKKILQGTKSRREKDFMFNLLKDAGYESVMDLAMYYNQSKHTYFTLIKELNDKSNGEYFTIKWLERHMMPLLPKNRGSNISRVEQNVSDFVSSNYHGTISLNDRNIVDPYELDIYLPDKNIAIEINGDFWHSDMFVMKNHGISAEDYHTNKSEKCAENNIQLVYIWESDWNKNRDKCCDAIVTLLDKGIVHPILMKMNGIKK